MQVSLARRLAAEGLGTALLLATVVGSGIMGERLAGGNVAVALLANTLATGAALVDGRLPTRGGGVGTREAIGVTGVAMATSVAAGPEGAETFIDSGPPCTTCGIFSRSRISSCASW